VNSEAGRKIKLVLSQATEPERKRKVEGEKEPRHVVRSMNEGGGATGRANAVGTWARISVGRRLSQRGGGGSEEGRNGKENQSQEPEKSGRGDGATSGRRQAHPFRELSQGVPR